VALAGIAAAGLGGAFDPGPSAKLEASSGSDGSLAARVTPSRPAARPRPSASPRAPSPTGLQPSYDLGNGIVVQQNSGALWIAATKVQPWSNERVDFVVVACPEHCADRSPIRVTTGTFERGLLVGWRPCPDGIVAFECWIYEVEGKRPIPVYEAVRSREDLVAAWIDRYGGAVTSTRQVDGIDWTIVRTHDRVAGLAVDGDRLVVVAADRFGRTPKELDDRFRAFLEALRFVDPSLTWRGAQIRTPDGWQITNASDSEVLLRRFHSAIGQLGSMLRIRAVSPGERVWITQSSPNPFGIQEALAWSAAGHGFWASGSTFHELRRSVEAAVGAGQRRRIDGHRAWTWTLTEASFFGAGVRLAIVEARDAFLVVSTVLPFGAPSSTMERLLEAMTFR
jgi:hypothetical protein